MRHAFTVEHTLGRLARWLRLLGFDAIYEEHPAAAEAVREELSARTHLTRTRAIRASGGGRKVIFIESDHLNQQLRQVIAALGITVAELRPFSRCLSCNRLIEPVEKSQVREAVPEYVWQTHNVFHRCPGCQKIYWPGSHLEHSQNRIRKLFDE
jgi:uncharacterized protein with PIN domain